jgi:dolichol kinase
MTIQRTIASAVTNGVLLSVFLGFSHAQVAASNVISRTKSSLAEP